jgi:DNA-binding transcriptional ArsR family regulator
VFGLCLINNRVSQRDFCFDYFFSQKTLNHALLIFLVMSSRLASMHKILKDETRRKIILLLHNRGGVSYSDLLIALKTTDRGRVNYHLKSLSPLIIKKDAKYVLNDKGMLAWKVLQEFSYKEKSHLATILKYGRTSALGGLAIIFFLSYNGYFNPIWLLGCVTAFSILVIATVAIIKVQSNKLLSCHSMDYIDSSLLKALDDENRRKIVRLLRENGTLSYSELMKATPVHSSGKMNYHLKVLDDLLSTNEKCQYSLTEKGVFAYTSLNSFQNKKSLLKINTPWRQWIGPTILSTLYLLGIFFLYSRGKLDFEVALLNLISAVLASSALFYLSRVNDNLKLDKVKKMI